MAEVIPTTVNTVKPDDEDGQAFIQTVHDEVRHVEVHDELQHVEVHKAMTIVDIAHIEKRHMFNGQQGKSLFIGCKTHVLALIEEVLSNPEKITAQRKTDGRVYQKVEKRFDTPVGVDGRSGAPCYFVTVIYYQRNNCVVTAYPTVKL